MTLQEGFATAHVGDKRTLKEAFSSGPYDEVFSGAGNNLTAVIHKDLSGAVLNAEVRVPDEARNLSAETVD